jgi:hypothetical protein
MGNASYYEDIRNRIDDALFMQGISESDRATLIQANVDAIIERAREEHSARVDLRKRVKVLEDENRRLRRDAADAKKRLQAKADLLCRAEKLIIELVPEKRQVIRPQSPAAAPRQKGRRRRSNGPTHS